MKREIPTSLSTILLLQLLLLVGCSGEKTPAQVEESSKSKRIFNTQRSALEQARETADFVGTRNRENEERSRDLD